MPADPAIVFTTCHTVLGAWLTGSLSLVCLFNDSTQGILERYSFNRKWYYLYGLLCFFAYMYMRPFIRIGLGSASRGYINTYTAYIVWLCSAVFYHLPSFNAMGVDIKTDLSMLIVIFLTTATVLGVLYALHASAVSLRVLPPRLVAPGASAKEKAGILLVNAMVIAVACSTYLSFCGNGMAVVAGSDTSSSPLKSAVCTNVLRPILTAQYPKFSAWMIYGEGHGSGGAVLNNTSGAASASLPASGAGLLLDLNDELSCSIDSNGSVLDCSMVSSVSSSVSPSSSGGYPAFSGNYTQRQSPQQMLLAGALPLFAQLQSLGRQEGEPARAGDVLSPVFTMWITMFMLYLANSVADLLSAGDLQASHISEVRVVGSSGLHFPSGIPRATSKSDMHRSGSRAELQRAGSGSKSDRARAGTRSDSGAGQGGVAGGGGGYSNVHGNNAPPRGKMMRSRSALEVKRPISKGWSQRVMSRTLQTLTRHADALGNTLAAAYHSHAEHPSLVGQLLEHVRISVIGTSSSSSLGGDCAYHGRSESNAAKAATAAAAAAAAAALEAEAVASLSQPNFLPMVPWYSGTSADLFKTMFDLMVSLKLFLGRFDMRTMQAATASSMADSFNDTPSEGDGFTYEQYDDREDLWFDFIADTGDGGNPTYTVAKALAAPQLNVSLPKVADSQHGHSSSFLDLQAVEAAAAKGQSSGKAISAGMLTLPRGELLLIGGDLAYPNPSRDNYEERLFRPFQDALPPPAHYHPGRLVVHKPDLPPLYGVQEAALPTDLRGLSPRTSRHASSAALRSYRGPHCFAIPGNHDWIDGLETFIKHILHKGWLGGWLLPQEKSYFALKLPHGWWQFGLDLALVGDIDMCQYRYFANVVEQRMQPDDQVIIMTHEPLWLLDWFWERPDSEGANLRQLIRGHLRGRARVWLAGDLHFYMRHSFMPAKDATAAAPGPTSASADPARSAECGVASSTAATGASNVAAVRSGDTMDAAQREQQQQGRSVLCTAAAINSPGASTVQTAPAAAVMRKSSGRGLPMSAREWTAADATAAAAAAAARNTGCQQSSHSHHNFSPHHASPTNIDVSKASMPVTSCAWVQPPVAAFSIASSTYGSSPELEGHFAAAVAAAAVAAAAPSSAYSLGAAAMHSTNGVQPLTSTMLAFAQSQQLSSVGAQHVLAFNLHAQGTVMAVPSVVGFQEPTLNNSITTAPSLLSASSLQQSLSLSQLPMSTSVHPAVDQNPQYHIATCQTSQLASTLPANIPAILPLASNASAFNLPGSQHQGMGLTDNSSITTATTMGRHLTGNSSLDISMGLGALSPAGGCSPTGGCSPVGGSDEEEEEEQSESNFSMASSSLLSSRYTSQGQHPQQQYVGGGRNAVPINARAATIMGGGENADGSAAVAAAAAAVPLYGTSPAGGSSSGYSRSGSGRPRRSQTGGMGSRRSSTKNLRALRQLPMLRLDAQGLGGFGGAAGLNVKPTAVGGPTGGLCEACQARLQNKHHMYDPEHLICNGGGGAFLHPTHIFAGARFRSLPDAAAEATASLYSTAQQPCTCRVYSSAAVSFNPDTATWQYPPVTPHNSQPSVQQQQQSLQPQNPATTAVASTRPPLPTSSNAASKHPPTSSGRTNRPAAASSHANAAPTTANSATATAATEHAQNRQKEGPQPSEVLHGGEYVCKVAYPSAAKSRELGKQNLHLFRLKNTRFDVFGGVFYFLLIVSVIPRCSPISAVVDASTVAEALHALAAAFVQTIGAIFSTSYLSLAAVMLMFLMCLGLARAGGAGAVPGPSRHGPVPFARSGGLPMQLGFALAHTATHVSLAVLLMLLLELGVETCIRHEQLGKEGLHSLYRWYRTYEAEHFPDPMGLRQGLEQWTAGLYPGGLKVAMAVFDIPEAIAVTRTAMCEVGGGMADLSRLQVLSYYLGMLAYYWLLATPAMGFVFGLYLYVAVCVAEIHYDEAFSALRVPNFKALTRMHITRDGDLEVYTLAVDKVPSKWREDPFWRGPQGGGNPGVAAHKAHYPSRWIPASSQHSSDPFDDDDVPDEWRAEGGHRGGSAGGGAHSGVQGVQGIPPRADIQLKLVDYLVVKSKQVVAPNTAAEGVTVNGL